MNRHEKIRYIRESKLFNYAYESLEDFTDHQLDDIIRRIAYEMQKSEATAIGNKVQSFYVFLN
ncbi:MAG: hypothetical protein ACOZCO_06870 [Bacteroidota bacterium]